MLELDDSPGTTKGTWWISPGTTRGTKSSVLQRIFPIFGQMWLLTTGPLTSVIVLFAELTR